MYRSPKRLAIQKYNEVHGRKFRIYTLLTKGGLCRSISLSVPGYSNVAWYPAEFNMFARLFKLGMFANNMHHQVMINIRQKSGIIVSFEKYEYNATTWISVNLDSNKGITAPQNFLAVSPQLVQCILDQIHQQSHTCIT